MDSFCGRGEVLKRSRTSGESPAKGYFRPETSGEDKEIAVSCEKILSSSGRIVVVVVLTHLSIHFLFTFFSPRSASATYVHCEFSYFSYNETCQLIVCA